MQLKTNLVLVSAAVMAWILAFAGTSAAAAAVDPSDGSSDLFHTLYGAFTGGHYAYAAALGLVLLVAGARKYLAPRWAPLDTDAGTAVLVLLGSFGITMSAGLAGGGDLSASMAWAALGTAFTAMGGYTAAKKLIVDPIIRPLSARAPGWLQPLFSAALWIFDHEAPQDPAPAAPDPAPAAPAAPTAGGAS